jgi:probable phosphomutase (TIGR03848 family)
MAIILLIRHGENNLVGRRMAGRLPGIHLNERGQSQAAELAERLCHLPIQAIYSSPLERAIQTAAPLAEKLNQPVRPAPWLVEVDFGTWQGKTFKQLRRQKLWKMVQEQPAATCFPGGESLSEVQVRVAQGLEELAANHPPEDMLACFTHGDIIRLAAVHFLNMQLNDFQRLTIGTASITAFMFHDGQTRLLCYNQMLGFEDLLPPAPKEKKDRQE